MSSNVELKPGYAASPGDEIVFELTERCNNDCMHCCVNLPADCKSAAERELSINETLAVVEEAASLGYLVVRFTGGEPLLRRDFAELYLSVRRMGMKVRLFTNGTLITPELADLFARIPPLEKVEITVYGMHQESYEAASRTLGSFEAAWQGIQLLLDRKVPLHVKGAMLPLSLAETDEFRLWAATIPGMHNPPPYSMDFTLRCRRDSEKKNDLIRRVRLSPKDAVAVLNASSAKYRAEMLQFASRFLAPCGPKLFACGTGVCIDPYGFLFPCTELRHPDAAYDLRRGSLADALDVFLPRLRSLNAINPDFLARCANCFLRGLCGQCPAKSYSEHGTMDTPVEYFCAVAHEKARDMGLLESTENGWEISNWKERIKAFVEKNKAGLPAVCD